MTDAVSSYMLGLMEETKNIRNFVIIAHIDSGKSTLADRLLEITGTVPMRSMRAQYLDRMPLERERGITIKMAPVRMEYQGNILNLIDTPGHSDFSYEVSRALIAVEGAILLIDGTKGVQAQTLSNLRAAQKAGLTIIPAVNKIDLGLSQIEKVVDATAELLGVSRESIFKISAKTGAGVKELLDEVVRSVPTPKNMSHISVSHVSRALIFDSLYDDHKGIIANVRVFEGEFKTEDMRLIASGVNFKPKEVGFFSPDLTVADVIKTGEIGYIATGLKEPAMVKIGDTIIAMPLTHADSSADSRGQAFSAREKNQGQRQSASSQRMSASELALPGYKEVGPVVFISFYPDGGTKFDDLKRAFEKLRLNDAALSFEPDSNEALGRGLKVGFLGQLHFEITSSRLVSEYNLEFLTSFPSIAYRVLLRNHTDSRGLNTDHDGNKSSPDALAAGKQGQYRSVSSQSRSVIVKQPQDFPDKPEKVWEPLVALEILTPQSYLSSVLSLQTVFDLSIAELKNIGENLLIEAKMPLRELIRDFDDRLKSASQGYASFTYELSGSPSQISPAMQGVDSQKLPTSGETWEGWQETEVEKLEILVVDEVIPALTRIVPKKDLEREGRQTAERLKGLLPQEQFSQAIQARSQGRIIARETIPAMKKELGNFGKNGGDRTRKMKLWKKQQRGKERLQENARVNISPEVFREILKK
jgi:GTP-binding protein LepA